MVQAVYSVLEWIYGSANDNVLNITMELDQHARDLWVAIENLFTDNKEPCMIYLSNQFHSFVLGDLTISE